jgi:hypothetical protein
LRPSPAHTTTTTTIAGPDGPAITASPGSKPIAMHGYRCRSVTIMLDINA